MRLSLSARACRAAFVLAALGFAALAAPAARAQSAAAPGPDARVLRAWSDPVKLDDGTTVVWHHAVTFDPATGETVRTTRLDDGTVVARVPHRPLRPTADEIAEAHALILAHPEVAALARAAGAPVVDGGFLLVQPPGQPCGPGTRCVQFDVLELADPQHPARLRYVVVDLRAGRVVDADFQPARDGNRF